MITIPKCSACYKFFPPNFMVEIEGTTAKKCFFCEQGKNELNLIVDGKSKKYTKDECIKEYHEYLNKLKQSKGVAKILANKVKDEKIIR